jgi:flagellar basal-body rod protein FlgF
MDNSIYITLSRQMAMFRDMEATANNIANANTTGYNAEKLMFADYLVKDGKYKDAYADDPLSWRDTKQGGVKTTNNTFDVAISGENAYFQLQTPLGVRYTRAGNFQVNAEGTLVNIDGYPVLGGDGGEIAIPDNARNVMINGGGQIMADGENIGDLGIMQFNDEQALKRMGNSLYSSDEAPLPSETARIVQGAVETSNVNPITEMVRVMELSRSTSSTAKFIEVMYDLQRKTSSTYTRSQS